MAFHGKPRYTGDLDIFIRPTLENAARLVTALKDFGAPSSAITTDDWIAVGTTVTLGVPPRRIDILNWLSGLDWEAASSDAEQGDLGSVPVRFLSLRTWRINKTAADRGHDIDDLRKFE